MKLDGTTICVTGGNKGIGAEIVKQVINKVKRIYIIDRSEQIFYHDKIVYVRMDLGYQKPKDLPVFDVFISNLGKNIGQKTLKESTEEECKQMIEININTHIWFFKNTKWKKFVFISSILTFIGLPKYSLYCASKAFLRIFNESMQCEGHDTLIVYPYKIDTTMFMEINDIYTLKATYVAKKIIVGIEKDYKEVYIPYIFKPLLMLKVLLPSFIVQLILRLIVKLFYKSKILKKD